MYIPKNIIISKKNCRLELTEFIARNKHYIYLRLLCDKMIVWPEEFYLIYNIYSPTSTIFSYSLSSDTFDSDIHLTVIQQRNNRDAFKFVIIFSRLWISRLIRLDKLEEDIFAWRAPRRKRARNREETSSLPSFPSLFWLLIGVLSRV